MKFRTLLLSLLTTCTGNSALAQTFNEVVYSPKSTTFSLTTSPDVKKVDVVISDNDSDTAQQLVKSMKRVGAGKWKLTVKNDLKGKYYVFSVYNQAQPDHTPGVFAKAVGVNGKRGAIVDLKDTDPDGWADDVRPELKNPCDLIIYEMHHRDFSMDMSSGIKNKGKFLALTEPAAISHLRRLGVNAVHILPSFDFASIDESKPDVAQYNWGYDPLNYNVPEGSYSTNAADPKARIREFKQMVQALHKAGIRVILDVVYNHTFDINGSNFQKTYPDYFFRKNAEGKYSDGSGCGNETASDKELMREFMKESVAYWVNEYHIDGFRFDLMGVHDIETMNEIHDVVAQIDPTIYILGEGWTAGKAQLPDSLLAMKKNVYQMPGVAAFSDEFRDGLRGPFGDDAKGGFIVGRPHFEADVRYGIVGGISHPQLTGDSIASSVAVWANSPMQFVSYVSCHDDLCLFDRLRKTVPGASVKELYAWQKLAETAVLTSQGVPFIYSGDEILRSKFGVANSYNSGDSINAINWGLKTIHREVFDYVKGLIAMRKAHPAFHLGSPDLIRKHLEFIHVPATNVVAFRLKGKPCGDSWLNTIVVLNARTEPIKVDIPDGKYWIACRDGKIDLVLGLGTLQGNQAVVAPMSAMIIHQ